MTAKMPLLGEVDRKSVQGWFLLPVRLALHEDWPRMTLGSHVQVWFLQRRFHKDILLNPVLVLSFCPDLSSKPGHLGTATREFLFLLDGSSVAHKACGGHSVGRTRGWWGSGLRWAAACAHTRSLSHTHTDTSLPDSKSFSHT